MTIPAAMHSRACCRAHRRPPLLCRLAPPCPLQAAAVAALSAAALAVAPAAQAAQEAMTVAAVRS